jgi:hypothetical protein
MSVRGNNALMVTGRIARVLLWVKLMVVSTMVWGISLVTIAFAIVLPWKHAAILNILLIALGVGIGYLGWLYDRTVWRLIKATGKYFDPCPLPSEGKASDNSTGLDSTSSGS